MIQVMVRPRTTVNVRVGAHLLGLANRADAWDAGSGATQESGRIFGYALRPSGGRSRLIDVLEGAVDWRANPRWSLNGYLGVATAGPVVRTSFLDGPALFFYIENVVQF